MKQLLIYIIISLVTVPSIAQQSRKEKRAAKAEKINALIRQQEEGVLVYKKHTTYGGGLATDGYGIFVEKGIKQDIKKTTLYRFELYEKKHPKEDRAVSANQFGQVNTAIFYKMNNMYTVRLGYGLQYTIGGKGNRNGIDVSAVGLGGLTLGLLKPYLYDVGDNSGKRFRANWEQIDTTLTITNLFGASGFSQGWNGLKVKPGAFAKAGLRFDYGKFNEMVNAVEVGLMGEFYSSKINQMYKVKQRNTFISAYITILLGRRK